MAKIYRSFGSNDEPPKGQTELLQVYNGLDCCMTLEVLEALLPQLDEVTSGIYDLERSLQGPVLEMELRGIRVDQYARNSAITRLTKNIQILEKALEALIEEGLGIQKFLNFNSTHDLRWLLYDVMGLPPQRNFKTKAPSVDRKALEKLREYFYAGPIVNYILAIRDFQKQRTVLQTEIDSDGRWRTSFNIAGTDTGRFSSYSSAFNTGSNSQNVTEDLRNIFIADPGMRMAYIDLEQAESRAVGAIEWNLFGDGKYLDACESSDLHTYVARMCFTNLPWTGDLGQDKVIAKQPFHRKDDYRQGSKKLSHGSNYTGKPPQMARETHIPLDLVQSFQKRYFTAFPAHPQWHQWVRNKLYKDGFLTTFMGRRRAFFGRRWDDDTHRSAVAYEPQSAVADYLSKGILAIWNKNLPVQLLLQVHDAIVVQYPEELEGDIIPELQRLLEVEVPLMSGRTLKIPTEAMIGWNWGKAGEANPNGLKPFGKDTRIRVPEGDVLSMRPSEIS